MATIASSLICTRTWTRRVATIGPTHATQTARSSARSSKRNASTVRTQSLRTPPENLYVTEWLAPAGVTRSSRRAELAPLLQACAKLLELPAIRRKRFAVELDDHAPAGRDEPSLTAGVQQSAVRFEPVARRVDRVLRLVVVTRIVQ